MGVATVAVLFTDAVDSTSIAAGLGPRGADEARRAHFDALRSVLGSFDATEVKTTGDGLMVIFRSPSEAASCADAMRSAIRRHRGPSAYQMRVGIAFGEATEEDGDWFGMPVVRAARLCAAAEAGEILTDRFVAALADHTDATFDTRGDLTLKGITDPVPAFGLVGAATGPSVPLPLPLQLPAGSVFVGRTTQLAALRGAWTNLRKQPTTTLVLIAGEPGAGKTSIAAAFARSVHEVEGAVVLFGRCDDGAGFAYQPFAQAIGHYVKHADQRTLQTHVTRHGGELARLTPQLVARIDDVPVPLVSDPASEQWRLFEAVLDLLSTSDDGSPILLVIDDLHWASEPTLLLLTHLLKSDDPPPVLIVATYRDTELARIHPLSDALAELRRLPPVQRVRADGLDVDEMQELVAGLAGHDLGSAAAELVRALRVRTEGNPFFSIEVLRHLAEAGELTFEDGRWRAPESIGADTLPEGVKEVVGRRLRRLPERTNEALAIAAIAGLELDAAVVAHVVGSDIPHLLDDLAYATRAGIVSETGQPNRFTFTHALIRDTLRDEAGASRRVQLHGHVAEAIEAVNAADLEAWLPELAMHHAEAAYPGHTRPAVEYALRAAEQARLGAASAQAVAILERGLSAARLDRPPNPELVARILIALAEATSIDNPAVARPYATEASEVAEAAGLWDLLARAAASMWSTTSTTTAGGVSGDRWLLDLCERALEHGSNVNPGVRALVMAMSVNLRQWAGEPPQASTAAEAMALAEAEGNELAVYLTAATDLMARAQTGLSPDDCARVLDRLETITTGDRHVHMMAAISRSFAAAFLGSGDRFDASVQSLRDAANDLNSPRARAWAAWLTALSALRTGAWDKAIEATTDAREASPDKRIGDRVWAAHVALAMVHQGRAPEFLPAVAQPLGDEAFIRGTLGFRSWVEAMAGDHQGAALSLSKIVENRLFDRDPSGLLILGTSAWAAAVAGDPDCTRVVEEKLRHFTGLMAYGGIIEMGSIDGLLGRLAFVDGRHDEADALFASGLALEEGFGAPVFAAYTRLWWARCLVARGADGDPARATTLLTEAIATADRLGMAQVAAEARTLAG